MEVKMLCSVKYIGLNDDESNVNFLQFALTKDPNIFKNEFLSEGFLKAAGQIACAIYLDNPYFFLKTEYKTKDKQT